MFILFSYLFIAVILFYGLSLQLCNCINDKRCGTKNILTVQIIPSSSYLKPVFFYFCTIFLFMKSSFFSKAILNVEMGRNTKTTIHFKMLTEILLLVVSLILAFVLYKLLGNLIHPIIHEVIGLAILYMARFLT